MLTMSFADKSAGTIAKAHQLIDLYKELGVDKERVLIKVGYPLHEAKMKLTCRLPPPTRVSRPPRTSRRRASSKLHSPVYPTIADMTSCNLTLLFGFGQAVACAEAGVTLISPFVGRVSMKGFPLVLY